MLHIIIQMTYVEMSCISWSIIDIKFSIQQTGQQNIQSCEMQHVYLVLSGPVN